jgi:glutamate racemase
LAPLVAGDVDTLLLGCTHYPYLARTISDVMGRDVVLVSSADETAFEIRALLFGHAATTVDREPPLPTFLTTGDAAWFTDLGGRLLGPELVGAKQVAWD